VTQAYPDRPSGAAGTTAEPGPVLGDLAEISPDLLAALEPDGRLAAINPAWHAVLGWDADELVGHSPRWLAHPEDRSTAVETFASMVDATARVVDVEMRMRTRDGDWRWISWSASVDPESGRVFASGRDVTRRAERHLAVRTSETLLAHAERIARLGSWEWDPESQRIRCSRELRRIGGLQEPELTYDEYMQMLRPVDRARVHETVTAAIRERRGYEQHYTIRRPDGAQVKVFERGEPIMRGDRLLQYVGTVQDVTDQRQREADLRRALATEQEATERLRHLDQLKSAFLSAVSHELRTPLTVLRGLAQTLQQHDEDLDVETRRRIQASLVDQSTRLAELVTDLLDLNRLVRGRELPVSPRPVDLVALARAVVGEQIDAGRVRMEAPASLSALVDPVHVERILVNLLDNARKYAPNGEVVLRLVNSDGGVRLEITDEGPGIPSEARELVFEPFYRADQQHPQPGTGVGLALVAEFARLHRGRAWAQEAPGGGAMIIVDLPDVQPEIANGQVES
jgi:PAS domain S-box-containing protein